MSLWQNILNWVDLWAKGFGTKAASKPRPRRGLSVWVAPIMWHGTLHTNAHAPCRGRKVSRAGWYSIMCLTNINIFRRWSSGRIVELSNSEISFVELIDLVTFVLGFPHTTPHHPTPPHTTPKTQTLTFWDLCVGVNNRLIQSTDASRLPTEFNNFYFLMCLTTEERVSRNRSLGTAYMLKAPWSPTLFRIRE